MEDKEVTVVNTNNGKENGQDKCPKCGSTDISINANNEKLRCNFCRYEFEPEKITGMVEDLSKLSGQVIATGASDIAADEKDVITLKCTSCGAEVVIDTNEAMQARCHWCRNTLSINEQIPNGSVPDVLLPFSVPRDDARLAIEKFVGKRKFFAHPKFRQEFTTNNIMGVYFPYMLVDINAHVNLAGEGEHLKRKYYVGDENHQEARYDADLYHVEREFDLVVDGLSIESNSDRLNVASKAKTNNIINAIMPFDVENAVKFNANYTRGYNSEKRDININQLKNLVNIEAKDIARFAANHTLDQYDRGVCWQKEDMNIKGQQWKSAYLPVWLYSYQEKKKGKSVLHYVAVNARTKETMGSIPIHMPKLISVSLFVELLGVIAMIFIDFDFNWIFLLAGFIYFFIIHSRYRNANARHDYETKTKKNMTNLRKMDTFIKTKRGLSNSTMTGANNKRVNGKTASSKVPGLDQLKEISNSVIGSDEVINFLKDDKK